MCLTDMGEMMKIEERGEWYFFSTINLIRRGDFTRPYFDAVHTVRNVIIFLDTVSTLINNPNI